MAIQNFMDDLPLHERISSETVIAELSTATGLSDQELIRKMPELNAPGTAMLMRGNYSVNSDALTQADRDRGSQLMVRIPEDGETRYLITFDNGKIGITPFDLAQGGFKDTPSAEGRYDNH